MTTTGGPPLQGGDATKLLIDSAHRHHPGRQGEEALVEAEDRHPGGDDICANGNNEDNHNRQKLPWWKRPSPLWLLVLLPVSAATTSATIAPRIEVYTMLACSVHKPDIFKQTFMGVDLSCFGFPYDDTQNSVVSSFKLTNSSAPFGLALGRVYLPGDSRVGLQNHTDKGPKEPNLCASDPVVQAAVAKLTAVISASMGVLSCVTTAWWGSFSDRHGRTRVLGITMIGLLVTDFNFIFVSLFSRRIPGGYWFLIVGPLIEGSVGGLGSAIAAMHAYMADTTDAGTRSRTFSLSLGLLFAGMAIGPTLGGLLIRFTHRILSVFILATAMHLVYTFLMWFVVPESLSQSQMHQAKVKYREEVSATTRSREMNPAVGPVVWIKKLLGFLSPLAVFIPEIVERGPNPLKKRTRDWSLTLLAAAYGFAISVVGSLTYKFQYASSTFGWTSETIGYWLGLIGAARAVYLTLILPVVIKLFKPKSVYIQLPQQPTETQPLLVPSSTTSNEPTSYTTQSNSSTPNALPIRVTRQKEIHSPTFDLALVRVSLLIEIISYTFMGLAPTPLAFTIFGMLGAFGVGFSPALQSVALELYTRRGGTESGRLFGALSVIQALCSQILGPAIFGLTYMKTVADFPRAIFFLSVGAITISSVLLCLVRLPKDAHETVEVDAEHQGSHERTLSREATLVDIVDEEGEERGREAARSLVYTDTGTSL